MNVASLHDIIPMAPLNNNYKNLSINDWVNRQPRHADFKIGHVLQSMFEKILIFIKSNKLRINGSIENLFNEFVNFAYYNRNKYTKYE